MGISISEVYAHYQIPPRLQEHMLRVAAVAALICDHCKLRLNKNDIISTALLHDMGNIIKFDFSNPALDDFYQPEGKDYWMSIQQEFVRRYGNDEHVATEAIARQLAVSKPILKLIAGIGFSKAEAVFKSKDFEQKLCLYSDNRVALRGVTSQEERMQEGRKRYFANKHITISTDEDTFDHLAEFMRKIEAQIFTRCDINPDFISDETIAAKFEQLKSFKLSISTLPLL